MKKSTNNSEWLIKNAVKDSMSILSGKQQVIQKLIFGVKVRELKNIPKTNGSLVEIYRTDFNLDKNKIDQVFQVTLFPKAISAWHGHEHTTDRIFVSQGQFRIVLFDGRKSSPTYNKMNTFIFGNIRPSILLIPPKIWHGIQNLSNLPGSIINLVDLAYEYKNPDHWRIPFDSPEIPFSF